MKINYRLDNENYIIGYTVVPFNANKPFIVISNLKDITLHKTRIINNKLDNNGVGNKTYFLRQKNKLRAKRKVLLEAFDKYKTNVMYGIKLEDTSTKLNITNWYNDLLDLKEAAFTNVPNEIKYYL